MYVPPQYRLTDIQEVERFLTEHAFGILVSQGTSTPLATHIPMLLETDSDGQAWLVGHLAKSNPHWKDFEQHPEVLAIFRGPHAYISSSWYAEEEVPTWNYIAVHVHGHLEILDRAALLHSLHQLVDKYEQDSKEPIRLQDLSTETMRQISGIVGFRIRIAEIHAVAKLSQGREEDHPRIISELEERRGPLDQNIADMMRLLGKKDQNNTG